MCRRRSQTLDGTLRVGHYQCECAPGDYEANIVKVIEGLEFAEHEDLDIMVFPESFLTGYFTEMEKFQRWSWAMDGPEMRGFLKRVSGFTTLFMVGVNEKRDGKIFNTVILVERGEIRGSYSKAFPCSEHETPGREFPVFEKNGVKFGIVICADGGYIEPTRILALKGAEEIMGEVLQADLAAIGVEGKITVMEIPVALDAIFNKQDFDLGVLGDVISPDPDLFISKYLVPNGQAAGATGRWSNERVKQLTEEGRGTLDMDDRVEIYREIYDIAMDQVPMVWLAWPVRHPVMHNNVKGWFAWGDIRYDWTSVWLDK